MNNHTLQFVLDAVYLLLPLLFVFCCIKKNKAQYVLAVLMAVFNMIYGLLLSSMSALSIEGFTGWIILPLLFACSSNRSFYYALHCIRYIFLLIVASTALWKIRTGAIFNVEEMSAILLQQHTIYLVQLPHHWFARFVKYLVNHTWLSYSLYLLATLCELSFVIGFFTKKYDRLLIGIFIAFVSFDYFLMEINYFAWTAFLGCLWWSVLQEPIAENTTD